MQHANLAGFCNALCTIIRRAALRAKLSLVSVYCFKVGQLKAQKTLALLALAWLRELPDHPPPRTPPRLMELNVHNGSRFKERNRRSRSPLSTSTSAIDLDLRYRPRPPRTPTHRFLSSLLPALMYVVLSLSVMAMDNLWDVMDSASCSMSRHWVMSMVPWGIVDTWMGWRERVWIYILKPSYLRDYL